MAYGASSPSPPPRRNSSGRKSAKRKIARATRRPTTMRKPFVEEVEPTPTPILGDIKFQKTIYSQNHFRKKVDVSISELKPKEEEIDVAKFFNDYHKIFFDIPQQGINSHSTLIKESMDFVNDYVDFKDEQIADLELQIEALNQQIIDLQTAAIDEGESIEEDLEAQQEAIEAAALKAEADAEIGNVNDPNIYWSNNGNRLLYTMGLKDTAYYAENNQKLPDGSDPFEENKQKQLRKDTVQAYEKGGSSGIRENQEIRTYSEWKTDTEKRSSGGETRDIKRMLDYIRVVTIANYLSIIN